MSDNIEQQQKKSKIAREILVLARNTLLVNLRFLDAALSQFQYVPIESGTIATDGRYFFFNPSYILMTYQAEKEISVRDYLHVVMHCIFRHMYGLNVDREIWNLACDIAVEYTISELGLKSAAARRENEETYIFESLKDEIGIMTAEKIYRYYLDCMPTEKELNRLKAIFRGDDHELWYLTFLQIEQKFLNVSTKKQTNVQPHFRDDKKVKNEEEITESQKEMNRANRIKQEQIWKEISERIQMDLEVFSKSMGDTAGNLIQNLNVLNREKYDYISFLKKFAVLGEVMKINEDEFDYIFYTYGLKLYEKMPLIEPLEYKEVKRIKEFVIAIDTSGSVMGEKVQAFMQKTYNILKSTETFFSKINLHIIQCDAEIQEHIKITNQDEFDAWIQKMEIKGFGGTDFRPVFCKVEELIRNREFQNLKGLIYFTDGYGIFPDRKPDYETAFVFLDDNYQNPKVPPWAIKIVLQKDEL